MEEQQLYAGFWLEILKAADSCKDLNVYGRNY